MSKALIGHTGFVGSNLLSLRDFDATYNSQNIADMAGKRFSEVVCCGVSAVKWKANQDPVADWLSIEKLLTVLDTAWIEHFILVSTVDVYQNPRGVDETVELDTVGQAYGVNRVRIERWARNKPWRTTILRLPALFGPGLKKNVIFDLLTDNLVDRIDPRATFQWYDVTRLADDIDKCTRQGIDLVNICSEPVRTGEIAQLFFPDRALHTPSDGYPARYDVYSIHAAAWGSRDTYLYSLADVMKDLSNYVATQERAP